MSRGRIPVLGSGQFFEDRGDRVKGETLATEVVAEFFSAFVEIGFAFS